MAGSFLHYTRDVLNRGRQVCLHLGRLHPQYGISPILQQPLSGLIALSLLLMGRSIYLHDEVQARTAEVHHQWPDGVLPAELHSQPGAPQLLPEQPFTESRSMPELPGSCQHPLPLMFRNPQPAGKPIGIKGFWLVRHGDRSDLDSAHHTPPSGRYR